MLPTSLRRAARILHNKQKIPDIIHTLKPQESVKARHTPPPRQQSAKHKDDTPKYLRTLENLEKHADFTPGGPRGHINLLWRVREIITKQFGPAYKVSTFGSIKYGTASSTSDLDLIIIDPARPHGFDPQCTQRLPKIYKLNVLAKALRHGGFINVKAIPASVPIVKFKDKKTGIQCDININDQPGYWNSLMIQRYTTLCPHLRGLLMVLKKWAKPLGFNNPSPTKTKEPRTFSSYALALMTIAFLQQRSLLPNLQENFDSDVRERSFWNRKPLFLCDMRFNWTAKPVLGNDETALTALLIEWLEFWGNFDPDQQMVDIRLGGIIPRYSDPSAISPPPANVGEPAASLSIAKLPVKENDGGLLYNVQALERWEFDALCIIDPFIRIKNVGCNITSSVFQQFQEESKRAGADLRRRKSDQVGSGYVIYDSTKNSNSILS